MASASRVPFYQGFVDKTSQSMVEQKLCIADFRKNFL